MELDRNQWFMIGLLLLLVGVELRAVDTFVLNEKASKFLAEQAQTASLDGGSDFPRMLAAAGPTPRRTIKPPAWIGFALISVGSVIVLHSLAMKKPGGG